MITDNGALKLARLIFMLLDPPDQSDMCARLLASIIKSAIQDDLQRSAVCAAGEDVPRPKRAVL